MDNIHDNAIHYINTLPQTSKTDQFKETHWFLTPPNPGNQSENTPIQTHIFGELHELEKQERLISQNDMTTRSQILSKLI